MKTYRDVQIKGDRGALGALRERLLNASPWRTRLDLLSKGALHGLEEAIPFEYRGSAAPPALVWLVFEEDQARVTNIVPVAAGQLTHDQYNGIAAAFAAEVAQPLIGELDLKVALGPETYTLEDVAPREVVVALQRFSGGANKSTGTAHPMDAERWYEFLIAAHASNCELNTDHLKRWLIEEEGWEEEMAWELAVEYERGRSLLAKYDEVLGR